MMQGGDFGGGLMGPWHTKDLSHVYMYVYIYIYTLKNNYILSLTISTSDSPQKLNYSPSQQTHVLFWSIWVLVRTFKTGQKCNLTGSEKPRQITLKCNLTGARGFHRPREIAFLSSFKGSSSTHIDQNST